MAVRVGADAAAMAVAGDEAGEPGFVGGGCDAQAGLRTRMRGGIAAEHDAGRLDPLIAARVEPGCVTGRSRKA